MKINIFPVFLLVMFGSCTSSSYLFKDHRFRKFELLTLDKAIADEKKVGSKDVSPKHMVRIGEDIYPNRQQFLLASPKWFIHKSSEFEIQTDYYYSLKDSSVKVILYEWNDLKSKKDLFKTQSFSDISKHNELYQQQFLYLTTELSKRLGAPIVTEMEQGQPDVKNFRGSHKWESGELRAYLFMLGNAGGFRQIRLAIYKDQSI